MTLFRIFSAVAISTKLTSIYCCTRTMTDQLRTPNLQRLLGVKGTNDKTNDLVYCPPQNATLTDGQLIFFGGDVQDFPEAMLTHRDNKRYVKWNLEYTAELLHQKFPNKKVFVVRPARMHLRTFSCFDNFVSGNDVGSPEHSLCIDGLKHLCALLKNAKTLTSGDDLRRDVCSRDDSVVLIGFSKGCVVLNQLLYSFAALTESDHAEPELETFITSIKDMYWLDGGHSGGSNTWITDKKVLRSMSTSGIRVHIDVTPYQVKDVSRPWNGREEKAFRETLKHMGVSVERKLHFEDEPHSLELHFKILEIF